MYNFLFGWIQKTPLEDTPLDFFICSLEFFIIGLIVYFIGELIDKLERRK